MLEIGAVFEGKYKVLAKIGIGVDTVVCLVKLVKDERTQNKWVLKEIQKKKKSEIESVERGFIAEIDILKKLNHPALPRIIDFYETPNSCIIIMDYIEGITLDKQLMEYGAQPQDLVIEWARQICDVLDYLHTRQPPIIFREIKPANIVLKSDGTVSFIDFYNVYKYVDLSLVGATPYAAYEQLKGQQIDKRTDIYCLGATLYHLVTGCNPSEPPYEMQPIRRINSSLSSGLEKIICKCVQRKPEDRYQTTAELMHALDHYENFEDKFRKIQNILLNRFHKSS